MTGLFVVFEGGDSAGKTTQSELLCGWLKARGRAFVATRQPGGTEVGSHLRRLVLDPSFGDVSPRAEALMYAADKAQHVHELIAPALALMGTMAVSGRMAFFSDALGHSALTGVGIGIVLGMTNQLPAMLAFGVV